MNRPEQLIEVPSHALRIIYDYYKLQPKELTKLPVRVHNALDTLANYGEPFNRLERR